MARTFTRRQLLLIGVTLALAGCASQTQGLPAAISTTQATPTVPISGTQAISGATTTPTTATQPGSTTGIKIDYMKGVPASTNLNGAGATFPELLYKRWFADFSKLTGTKINYQGVGSGAGINQYTQGTVDFGASDAFLTDAQLAKAPGTLEIPMAAGSISVIVNIPELSSLKSGQLKLTGDTLAGIYLGTI